MQQRRVLLISAVFFWLAAAPSAQADCTQKLQPYWVSVEWGDGTTGGHWQWEWVTECTSGGGGSAGGGGSPGGGGGGTAVPPQQALADQYDNVHCDGRTNPTSSDFVKSSTFVKHGSWTFPSLKDPNYSYALITNELQYGLSRRRTIAAAVPSS